jgi:hypothetical protein
MDDDAATAATRSLCVRPRPHSLSDAAPLSADAASEWGGAGRGRPAGARVTQSVGRGDSWTAPLSDKGLAAGLGFLYTPNDARIRGLARRSVDEHLSGDPGVDAAGCDEGCLSDRD